MTPHHGQAIKRALLAACDSSKTAEELAKTLGLEPVEVRVSLQRMRVNGEVVREVSDFNRYSYRLPNKAGVPVVTAGKLVEIPAQAQTPAPEIPATEVPAVPAQPAEQDAPTPIPQNGVRIRGVKNGEGLLIVRVLKQYGPQSSNAIAEVTRIPNHIVHKRVNYLFKRGRIEIANHNRPYTYRLPLQAQAAEQAPSEALTERLETASHSFAAALNVPESVLQCTYIAIQVEAVIAKLHRPANSVLVDLVAASQNLRSASALLAKEANKTGATP